MALTPKFNANDVRQALLQRMKRMDQAVYSRLQRIGEQFIADAREDGAYGDVTGNLRNSLGYVILKDGVQVGKSFEGGEGGTNAQRVTAELSLTRQRGYVLLVVAGMEYAAAVEAKGYDVLTMSGLKAEATLKKAMARIKQKA